MPLLEKWLNADCGLSKHVDQMEKDFASGYLLCELLTKKGVLDSMEGTAEVPPLMAGETGEDHAMAVKQTLKNFEVGCKGLEALGVIYKKNVISQIAAGERGAASALLMSVKKALLARGKPPEPPAEMSTASVRPKEFIRASVTDYGADDFTQVGLPFPSLSLTPA